MRPLAVPRVQKMVKSSNPTKHQFGNNISRFPSLLLKPQLYPVRTRIGKHRSITWCSSLRPYLIVQTSLTRMGCTITVKLLHPMPVMYLLPHTVHKFQLSLLILLRYPFIILHQEPPFQSVITWQVVTHTHWTYVTRRLHRGRSRVHLFLHHGGMVTDRILEVATSKMRRSHHKPPDLR